MWWLSEKYTTVPGIGGKRSFWLKWKSTWKLRSMKAPKLFRYKLSKIKWDEHVKCTHTHTHTHTHTISPLFSLIERDGVNHAWNCKATSKIQRTKEKTKQNKTNSRTTACQTWSLSWFILSLSLSLSLSRNALQSIWNVQKSKTQFSNNQYSSHYYKTCAVYPLHHRLWLKFWHSAAPETLNKVKVIQNCTFLFLLLHCPVRTFGINVWVNFFSYMTI